MTFAGHVMGRFTVPSGISISTTSTAGGTDTVNITAGDYYIDGPAFDTQSFVSTLQSLMQVNDASWTVTLSTGASGTGKVSISAAGTWSITWTSSSVRDILGFTANISSVTGTQTGTKHAKGLWLPDSVLNVDGNYLAAPRVTDLRQTESPTGFTIGLVGNVKYRHRNARWPSVPAQKTWIASEVTQQESFEQFLADTQWGLGHSWFSPSSPCCIASHTGSYVGGESIDRWYLSGCRSMEEIVTRHTANWDGYWSVAIPMLTGDG